MRRQAYGTWDSSISAEVAASSGVQFQDLVVEGDDIYWSEMRPTEAGRTVIVKYSPHSGITECLPSEFNARTRVHEYGGAAFTVRAGVLYFINDKDQRLYRQIQNEVPQAITSGSIRLADLHVTSKGIVAVAQRHDPALKEPENFLALVNPDTGEISSLASGFDFYASPAISKDETKLAWIAWAHPNMPWDNTTLWVADFTDGSLQNIQQIDPTVGSQSFFQPQWDRHNQLYVVSDKSNWWNLYKVKAQSLEPEIAFEGEMGRPMWVLGLSTWAFFLNGIAFSKEKKLVVFVDNAIQEIKIPYTEFSQIKTQGNTLICFGASPERTSALLKIQKSGEYEVLRSSSNDVIPSDSISVPLHIEFPSQNNRKAYGYFYAPNNPLFQGPSGTQPPLIVMCHGGPTGQTTDALNMGIQYWTSRGFAVVDVNYAGSTGYGRAFRQSLEGNWGIFEVQDCMAAVDYLIDKGWVEPGKIAMTGGSAGGLTVLSALATSNRLSAGCIRYGVTDLNSLVHDTHKFESRYLDRLIGPYPEQKYRYDDRSPINHTDTIHCPVIFFHGDEDKVVPLSQTEAMIEKLTARGIPCECIIFKGEQHGFRQAKNRTIVLERQLEFLVKYLKL
jgi:dipeptidyl aminopeptidase/acylaminoacyl peptidase